MSPSSSPETGRPAQASAYAPTTPWVTAAPPRLLEVLLHVVFFPRLVLRHKDLVTTSVRRELAARFQGTLLGWGWPLVTPLLLFAIYFFIFTKLLKFKFEELPPGQEAAMGVYMFVGVLVWSAFAETIVRCTGVIVDNGNLIKKVAFPTEVLPLNQVLVNLVTMMFGVVMFVVATWIGPLVGLVVWEPPSFVALVWIFVLLPLQVLFTYGFGLFLGTLQVYLRDTIQVVAVGITVWMFATPIFWAPQIVRTSDTSAETGLGAFDWIIDANPAYHLVYAWRTVLMSSEPALVFPTDMLRSIGIFAVWAFAVFVLGYTFFLLARRRFADEI